MHCPDLNSNSSISSKVRLVKLKVLRVGDILGLPDSLVAGVVNQGRMPLAFVGRILLHRPLPFTTTRCLFTLGELGLSIFGASHSPSSSSPHDRQPRWPIAPPQPLSGGRGMDEHVKEQQEIKIEAGQKMAKRDGRAQISRPGGSPYLVRGPLTHPLSLPSRHPRGRQAVSRLAMPSLLSSSVAGFLFGGPTRGNPPAPPVATAASGGSGCWPARWAASPQELAELLLPCASSSSRRRRHGSRRASEGLGGLLRAMGEQGRKRRFGCFNKMFFRLATLKKECGFNIRNYGVSFVKSAQR